MKDSKLIGIGVQLPRVVLHIANRPPLVDFEHEINRSLQQAEAADIIKATGNHWRKVFSILAKISFALFDTQCKTWQEYRDTKLLTENGFEYVCFSPLADTRSQLDLTNQTSVSILCGFSYAETQLDFSSLVSHQSVEKLKWSEHQQCLVTPYFDWRQLNNEMLKIVTNIIRTKLLIDDIR